MLQLYKSYRDILRPYGEKNDKDKKSVAKEQLQGVLRKLYEAMDAFDLDEVDRCMNQLEEYQMPSACQESMEMLRVYVADVAMEDIMKTAKKMIDVLR